MQANRFRFRAWVNGADKQTMVYDVNPTGFISAAENVILMQSTGLTDRNGVEIFEGDVLYIAGAGNAEARWCECEAAWMFCTDIADWQYPAVIEDIEAVRGNIHQHPELLKATK